ncbi:hypothetical protein FH972_024291 [Carpinus fangiana]|uniref:Acyltransferase 3 domain-containing protein n=1 Tax=Carpinus fangiana TaxID=176857 RepID=A0A5N6KXY7_9ROSI|nr:hypothetical protein FH972_024291 [Carpinus fangiana]
MMDHFDEKQETVRLLVSEELSPSEESSFDLEQRPQVPDRHKNSIPSLASFTRLPNYRSARCKNIANFALRVCIAILPSFIGDRFKNRPQDSPKLRPTAFLDGMRGVAAWCVFNTHLTSILAKQLGASWGHDERSYHFLQLPIVQLLYGGLHSVCLFFVISGIALSIGPISKMNKPTINQPSALRSLCSSTFRRPFRLFIPAFASTFLCFVLIRFDTYRLIKEQMVDETIILGWAWDADYPPRMESLWAQLHDLHTNNMKNLQIFNTYQNDNFKNRYNTVLWTIALEFRASLALFLAHAALYFIRRPLRIILIAGLLVMSLLTDSFEMPLFFAGYLVAEFWTTPTSASVLPTSSTGPLEHRGRRIALQIFSWILLAFGCFTASMPPYEPWLTPSFAWLEHLTPLGYNWVYFWIGTGCVLTVIAVGQIPVLVSFFSSAPIRYLGKISFSLYLVHIWIVRGFGVLIFYRVWSWTGKDNDFITFVGFALSYTTLLGIVVWIADIFWRVVEQPTVEAAKWVEGKLFRKD